MGKAEGEGGKSPEPSSLAPRSPPPFVAWPTRDCQAGLFWLPRHPRLRGRLSRSVRSLSDWGRKPESLLAFERINEFVTCQSRRNGVVAQPFYGHARGPAKTGFFLDALLSHRREGFLWQKLRMPRSFDYKIAEGKPFNEQLKMGRFELTDAQREAIITFILGLVDETPAAKYVYHPTAAQGHRRRPQGARQVRLRRVPYAGVGALDDRSARLELWGVPRLDRSGALQEDEDDDGKPDLLLHALGAGHAVGRPEGDVPFACRRWAGPTWWFPKHD